MPYSKLSELPDRVKSALPKHGQEIYRAAYNNAWDEYKDPEERKGDISREEIAQKIAWSAVKKVYQKNNSGEWVKKKG